MAGSWILYRKNGMLWCRLLDRYKKLPPHFRIPLAYLLFGSLWILVSDQALESLIIDTIQLTRFQTFKGWFYVFATTVFLYILIHNAFVELRHSKDALQESYYSTLAGWIQALDLNHHETKDHTQRVTKMTVQLSRRMGLGEDELENVYRGALLHDIGKLGIPDEILTKPKPLDEREWEIIKMHPVYAYELLSPIAYLQSAIDIPYCHHERWDGSGYPQRLRGEQIPITARIFAVIDVWDALSSDRVYRKAWPKEKVRSYIRAKAGTHFDPKVVEAFFSEFNLRPIESETSPNTFDISSQEPTSQAAIPSHRRMS
jgi:HD-GYP domain-containing protein (c-di-GMP phosphodiesterase class II)